MASAHDFNNLLVRIDTMLSDALAAAQKITDREELDYAEAAAITALDDLVAFTRKWLNTAEVKAPSSLMGFPVLSDAAVQRTLASIIARLNNSAKLVGSGGLRIANTLERLAREKNPRDAALMGGQAATVARNIRLEMNRTRPKRRAAV